jgi:hypothetical protein
MVISADRPLPGERVGLRRRLTILGSAVVAASGIYIVLGESRRARQGT